MNNLECINRDEFSNKLATIILESPSRSFQFIGKSGVGKEYVLGRVENQLKKRCDIYRIVSDSLMKKNQRISPHSFNIAFSISNFIGLSLTPVKNETLKINYIISNLKALTLKKIVVISALDYDILPTESREFIDILLYNKKFIEEKIKRKITVIVTSNSDYFNEKYGVENISFKDYGKIDVRDYLINICGYTDSCITGEKLNQIYKLCGTNFDLINNYSNFILNSDETNNTIKSIVDTKLNYYIKTGCKYSISKEELKSIIYASSMSIHMLTPEMISYINSISQESVKKGFECAIDENFLEEDHSLPLRQTNNFLFISETEKNYIYQQAEANYLKRISSYYIYLSNIVEDEYFERSQYLTRYYGSINKNVFTLIILALSKSFLFNDQLSKNKISSFFYENNSENKYRQLFDKIKEAYQEHHNNNYINSNILIADIDYSDVNTVLAAELRRLEFKNGFLSKTMTPQKLYDLSQELQTHLEKKLVLTTEFLSENKDEKILSLRIIFDIAPFILDTQNNRESFGKLYDNSLILANYINNHFINKNFAEYIINVFNRKAFLFASPASASLYYEQAVAYFKDNKIWHEYIIALASKAGNEIALHKYSKAINSCKEAIRKMEECLIDIPQKEKIFNNMYIAKFLLYETRDVTNQDLQEKALDIITNLESLLSTTVCGTNHVILTNIASLCLYAGKENKYNQIKECLESSLQCQDVSNVADVKINDFYRYHFAWYEFYANLQHANWRKCTQITNSLNKFYPSIFHNYEKMDLRVEAAQSLVKSKTIPDIKDYGINMLQYAPSDRKRHTSRGLPLSDLQYTSWE